MDHLDCGLWQHIFMIRMIFYNQQSYHPLWLVWEDSSIVFANVSIQFIAVVKCVIKKTPEVYKYLLVWNYSKSSPHL